MREAGLAASLAPLPLFFLSASSSLEELSALLLLLPESLPLLEEDPLSDESSLLSESSDEEESELPAPHVMHVRGSCCSS